MQHLQNNDVRKSYSERGKGLTGSIIIHVILLLLLVFVGFKTKPPLEEEGIMVNFGTDETGSGLIEPAPMAVSAYTPPPPPAPTTARSTEEPLLTQNDEEAPEVKKVDPNAERKRLEQAEAERRRRETLEAERKKREEEEIERKRIEAEQQRQADITNRTRNALAGANNAAANSRSEGIAGGAGNQGVPTGSIDSNVRGQGGDAGNGVSYNLGGRGHIGGLPMPKYDCQADGIVVVEIRVDRDGKVTQATPGRPGSTTIVKCLTDAAREAAMATKFASKPDAPAVQVGTITYNFKFR